MQPTIGHGKICYLEIPTANVERSAKFFETVFGWSIRKRGDGAKSFDDGVGQVSGAWRLDRKPQATPGFLIHIMVDDLEAILKTIPAHGGEITQPVGADAPEITAQFHDPDGNVFGLYQERRQ